MALSLPSQRSRSSIGLDLDGDHIAAVGVSHGRISVAVSEEMPPGLLSDGEVIDTEGLAAALKDFFKRHGLPRSVRLGIANQQIVVRQIELPQIADRDELAAAVAFQAQDAIPMPLDEVVLDHQVVGGTQAEDGSFRMRVIVVAARKSMVQALVDAVRDAGLRAEGIDLDAFAMVRTLTLGDLTTDGATVFVHLSAIANLAIAVGSDCLFSRPLAVDTSADGLASALADQIRPSIDSYLTAADAPPVERLLVSGPRARTEGLIEDLGAMLGIPVALAAPLGSLPGDAGEDPFRQTIAAGLALGASA